MPMIVPLMVGTTPNNKLTNQSIHEVTVSRCVGLAFVNYRTPDFYPSKGQFAFAQDIATQCALAVDKARLLHDAHQAANWQPSEPILSMRYSTP